MKEKRINLIKAMGILFVIIGHAIQYGSGNQVLIGGQFFEDGIFKFIYSFHMPLFMLVSGYLFFNTIEKYQGWKLWENRWNRLGIPILAWAFFPFIELLLQKEEITVLTIVKSIIRAVILNPWFLWAVLLSSIAVIIGNRYFRDNKFIYLLGFIFIFITPDLYNLHLYKYMYPYFVIGYFFKKEEKKIKEKIDPIINSRLYGWVITLIYAILWMVYPREAYIYVSGITLLGKTYGQQLLIDLFRFIIGGIGSMWIMWILKYLLKQLPEKILCGLYYLGNNSMGYYLISGVLFSYVVSPLTSKIRGINYLWVTVVSVAMVLVCTLVIELLKRNKVACRIFLGGRNT